MRAILKFQQHGKDYHDFYQILFHDIDIKVGDNFEYDYSYYSYLERVNETSTFTRYGFKVGQYRCIHVYNDNSEVYGNLKHIFLEPNYIS